MQPKRIGPPDWAAVLCELVRYYPAYKLADCADLTWAQIQAMMENVKQRPYEYACMVEPKKNGADGGLTPEQQAAIERHRKQEGNAERDL